MSFCPAVTKYVPFFIFSNMIVFKRYSCCDNDEDDEDGGDNDNNINNENGDEGHDDDDDGNCSLTFHVKDCIFMHLATTAL